MGVWKQTQLRQLLLKELAWHPRPNSADTVSHPLNKTANYRPFPGQCSFCMKGFIYLEQFLHDFTTTGCGFGGTRTFDIIAGDTLPELRSTGEHGSFRPS